jgi:hypothetical protein
MFKNLGSPDGYDSCLVSDPLRIVCPRLLRPLCKAGKGFPHFSIMRSL